MAEVCVARFKSMSAGFRGSHRSSTAVRYSDHSPTGNIAAVDGRQDKIGEVVIRMDESLKANRTTLSKIEKKLER